MSKKFDDILNECLNRMSAGENIEKCLQDYPDLSEELRPLLETASTVKASSNLVQPSQQFRALAKQRILAESRAKAEAQRQPKWYSFWQWQHQWAVALVAVLLVIFVGGGTTVAASSNAMPDDFLYPVKLAVEDVRLTFAGSDVDKAELQAEFANRRVDEIAKMAEEGKWGKVEATAERLYKHLQKIVNIATEKRAAGELDREDVVKLMTTMAHYATDHPLIFRKAVQQMPPEEKTVILRLFQAAKTQYAAAIEDLNIAVREDTEQSSVGTTTELDGIVRMIVDGKWVVGDQVVNIDDTTTLDIAPDIGTAVKIEAQYQADGSLDARKITLRSSVAPSNVTPDVVRPTPVETVDTPVVEPVKTPIVLSTPSPSPIPDRTPSSTSVETTDSTLNEPTLNVVTPKPTVRPIQTPAEVLNVPEIRTFSGVIKRITRSHWTVGPYTVITNNDTVIRGNPGVGEIANVWVTVSADGSLQAYSIWVQENDLQSTDVPVEPDSGAVEDLPGIVNVEPSTGEVDSSQSSVEPIDNSNVMTDTK